MNNDIKKYTSMRMALRGNLLTSDKCGNHCVFCSNKLNPDSVNTVKVGNRKIEDLINEIDFIPNDLHEIHLGETNFNTTEGEIIEYPYFKELIYAINKKRPDIHITITTSGNSLTEDKIIFLKEKNIDVFISIHSLNPELRAKITGNTLERANIAINSIDLCLKHKVNIKTVRLVPMPFIPDDDIYNTLKQLILKDIPQIHIWVASFSKFVKDKNVLQIKDECNRISNIIDSLEDIMQNHFTKILLFPFQTNRFKSLIINVKPYSYAYEIGLRNNDEIISMNDIRIVNSDHIKKILEFENIKEIYLKRENNFIKINNIENSKLILKDIEVNDNTIPFACINAIFNAILKDRSHSLLMSGEAGYDIVINNLEKMGIFKNEFYHCMVKNTVFGGSICVNGLITIEDYLIALNNFRKNHKNINITKIIIPADSFRGTEVDVTGRPLQDLKFEGCVDVVLI